MLNRPLIGILVRKRNRRKRILKLYQRYHNLNLKLYAFTSADIDWEMQRINGLTLRKGKWKQYSLPFPQAVYNRCFNKGNIALQHLEKAIGSNKCFNSINFFNKWEMYNHLKRSELKPYLPETFLYNEVNAAKILEKYKLIYIKPAYGCKGDSVYRVERKSNGDTHISLHSLAPRYICRKNEDIQKKLNQILEGEKYMVQQGINLCMLNHQYFDIRALVQKDIQGKWSVSDVICRVAYKSYFNTSICNAVYDAAGVLSQISDKILQILQELSVKAAQEAEVMLGSLGEISVDFVVDEQRKLWIMELNGKPQKNIHKGGIRSLKQQKIIYSRPIEYAYYLSQS